MLHQGLQVGISHLGGNGGVTQQAAEHRQGGMKRIKAGTHLHLLRLLHGGPVGEVHPRPLQGGPSIGEGILQHQILGDLRVDEGSNEGAGVGFADGHIRQAQPLQLLLDLLGGMGGDLIDHGPGEGHLAAVVQPGQEVPGHQPPLLPAGGDALHRILELLAVLGAVVHAHHGDGSAPRLEPAVEQGGGDGHGMSGTVGPALQVPLHHRLQLALQSGEGVALLGDGKAGHLQGGRLEYLHQPVPVGALAVGLQAAGHAADHLHLIGAVGRHADQQAQAVVRGIDVVNDLKIEGLGGNDTGIGSAGIQKGLLGGGQEAPEDVARAKVDPGRALPGALAHRLHIVPGKGDARRLPGRGIPQALCIQM